MDLLEAHGISWHVYSDGHESFLPVPQIAGVASAIGPHLEIVGSDGPGHRLVPAGDEAALAAALSSTVDGGPDVREGASRLRQRVLAEYSWDRAVDATEALYGRLVGEAQ